MNTRGTYRTLGVILLVSALAMSGSILAFSSASVNNSAHVAITATDQLLALTPNGSADNPAGMITQVASGPGTGKINLDLGSNGTTTHGIQADSAYTFDNVIRVKNNNATAKNITMSLNGAVPDGLTVEFSLSSYNAGVCGPVSYSATPTPVSTAAGAELCLSVKLVASSVITDGEKTLDFTVTAN